MPRQPPRTAAPLATASPAHIRARSGERACLTATDAWMRLARRGFTLKRIWEQVLHEVIKPEGAQCLVHTTAPGLPPITAGDVISWPMAPQLATKRCYAGLPCSAQRQRGPMRSGAGRGFARNTGALPRAAWGGPHRLCVLAAKAGGRWNNDFTWLMSERAALPRGSPERSCSSAATSASCWPGA